MYLYELLQSDIEFKCDWEVIQYDLENRRWVKVDPTDAMDKEIIYLDIVDDVLYIVVER